MKILLSGFEPFGKSKINPSELVVRKLIEEGIANVSLEATILPVDRQQGPATLLRKLDHVKPDAVLCLGLAARRPVISVERIAINLLDFRIPDNVGNQVKDQPIDPNGPAAYFTTLPVRQIFNALKKRGIPVEISLSAGAYLCNQVTFVLLHHLKIQGLSIPAGFIHLPQLPEQAAEVNGSVPSMSFETMIKGIRTVISVVAKE